MKQKLNERYKIIDVKTILYDAEKIINVDLWTDERRETDYHVNILIANHKLIYSGDCGTFVFGSGISTVKPVYYFFCGKKINPHYWKEKCEASSEPILNEEVDLDKVDEKLDEYLEDYDFREVEDAKIDVGYPWFVDANYVRVYDCICKILEQLEYPDAGIAASSIIDVSRGLNERYLYACSVIQWTCNKLAEQNHKECGSNKNGI